MNLALAVAWLAGCAVIAMLVAPAVPRTGFADAGAMLAFISLVAVAIERCIEGFFAVAAGRLGQWWPLAIVKAEFDTFERHTNQILGSVTRETREELEAARERLADDEAKVRGIQLLLDELDATQARLAAQLKDATGKLPPGAARLARVGEIGTSMSATLHRVHALAEDDTRVAQGLLAEAGNLTDGAISIIASFEDNPARRVASLVLGAGLGMLVAAGVGLNVFAATLGAPTDPGALIPAQLAGSFGVVLTGVLIGLGSAPTHEVVKSLQAYKSSRAEQVPVTTITPGSRTSSSVAGAVRDAVIAEGAIDGGDGAGSAASANVGTPAQLSVRRIRSTG